MPIKDMVKDTAADITAWFEYKHGIAFEFRHIDRRELEALTRTAKKRTWVNHQPVDELDEDKLGDAIVEAATVGWRGMTFRALQKLIPIDPARVDDWDEEQPFDIDDMKMLIDRVIGLGSFVFNSVTDLANFMEEKAETEAKN